MHQQLLVDLCRSYVLSGLQGPYCFAYLDDIVVHAISLDDHTRKFSTIFKRLWEHGLKLQPNKCEFLRHEVCYLDHVITDNGIKLDPKKISSVQNFPSL